MRFIPNQSRRCPPAPGTRRARAGFTLIEAAIVTAIVGFGIVALLELLAAGSMANAESAELTTAVFLANNINELMQGKDYATLKATYDGKTYGKPTASPFDVPVDGRGQPLAGFTNWAQELDVSYVDHDRITLVVPDTQIEPTSRVTVNIKHNGVLVYTARWLVAAPD